MFDLSILKVNEKIFEGKAKSLSCVGSGGEMTILANHAPLVSILGKGDLKYEMEGGEIKVYKSEGGVLEVSNNKVVVLL